MYVLLFNFFRLVKFIILLKTFTYVALFLLKYFGLCLYLTSKMKKKRNKEDWLKKRNTCTIYFEIYSSKHSFELHHFWYDSFFEFNFVATVICPKKLTFNTFRLSWLQNCFRLLLLYFLISDAVTSFVK